MAQDIVTVLSVETGGSERTIKALKEEIKTLKSTLEGTTIGSKSFEKASKDLAAAQAELKSVMDSTKKSVQAADGSYDALVATMAELRKEWKATADEAKRDEIGKQIDSINTKLKEMDATIGNHQRNVGNYKGDIIEAFDEMGGGAFDYGKALGEANKSTEATRGALDGVGKMSQGVASGFAAVQGVMALCGKEGGDFEKVMVKMTAAMSIAQGLSGMKGLIEGFGQLKTAFTGASMGAKTLTTAIGGLSAGLVAAVGAFAAVVVGAIALTGNMSKLKQKFGDISAEDKAAKAAAKLNTELTKLSSASSSEKIVRVQELSRAYKGLGDNLDDKKKFVAQFAGELETMGIKMNDVNDADNIFINNTQNYINALMARAKANAIKEKAQEDYAKFLEREAELEEKLADAIAKQNAGTPDKTFLQNIGEALISSSVYEGAPVDVVQDFNDDWTAQIAQDAVDAATKALEDARANANSAMEEAFAKAGEFDALANQYLIPEGTTSGGGSSSNSGSGSSGSSSTDDWAERLKAFYKERAGVLQELNQIEFDASQSQRTDQYDIEIEELERAKKQEIAVLGEYLNTKLKNEKTGEEHSLITQKEYDKAKLEVEAIYGKKIADVEKARLEKLNRLAKERLDAINKRFQDAIQTANTQYEISSATADAVGDEVTNARLLQNMLDAQNQALITKRDELLAYKTELGENSEAIAAVNAELEAVTNEMALNAHNRTMAIAAEKAAQLELINEIVGSVSDSMDQLLALDLGSKWSDELGMAFSAIQNGITQTSEALKSGQEGWKAYGQMAAAGLNAAAGILNSIAEKQDETDKDGFEKQKKLQIAAATMAMLGGIVSAVTSAFNPANAWMTIWGQAGAAAAMSSFVLGTGIAQIANIKKQTYNGSGGGDFSGAGATPNVPMGDMMPIQYTRELMTDTETTNLNKEQKVYVLESDITETQDNVAVKEANASF